MLTWMLNQRKLLHLHTAGSYKVKAANLCIVLHMCQFLLTDDTGHTCD